MKEVYGNRWMAWWRRNSTALPVAATISCNLAYFVEAGYTRMAAVLSMISLGKRIHLCSLTLADILYISWLRLLTLLNRSYRSSLQVVLPCIIFLNVDGK